jgi:hypothetical protein
MKKVPKLGTDCKKKPYTKPEIKKVQLRPEEAVLGGCKWSVAPSPGPFQPNCRFLGSDCSTMGS